MYECVFYVGYDGLVLSFMIVKNDDTHVVMRVRNYFWDLFSHKGVVHRMWLVINTPTRSLDTGNQNRRAVLWQGCIDLMMILLYL